MANDERLRTSEGPLACSLEQGGSSFALKCTKPSLQRRKARSSGFCFTSLDTSARREGVRLLREGTSEEPRRTKGASLGASEEIARTGDESKDRSKTRVGAYRRTTRWKRVLAGMAHEPVVVHYEPRASSPVTMFLKEVSEPTSLVPKGASFAMKVLAYVYAGTSEGGDASWLASKRSSDGARGTSVEPEGRSKRTEGAWLASVRVSLESWRANHVSRRRRLRGLASSVVRSRLSEERSLSWHARRGRWLQSL